MLAVVTTHMHLVYILKHKHHVILHLHLVHYDQHEGGLPSHDQTPHTTL